ncbi:ATP-binding protein [Geothermobacter hydrogeniphilus]|nr:ATP-binding protein [Geothermobacter hydrogeniphilus]
MRKKLLRWLLCGQLLAVVLCCLVSFYYVRGELEDLFDDRLRQLAYSVPVDGDFELPAPPPLTNLQDDEDDFVIQIWRADGTLLRHLNRKEGSPALVREGFSTHFSHDMLWRSFVHRRGARLIQASQPFSDRLEMTTGIAVGAIAPVLLLILVLGGIIWVSVTRSLRPLTDLTAGLRRRQPYALDPLSEENLPDELQPLVQALNSLLARLESAIEGQRRFVADAAHELRTPLAAVQLQAQVLQQSRGKEERQQALEQVRVGTERATHLVRQLLTLARLEPEDRLRLFEPVDLCALVKTVVAEQAPTALKREIDLGVCEAEPLTLIGDSEGLRILLGNLVDNAVRYTPSGGQIDVALRCEGGQALLVVEDNGPGIPAAERTRVFERFYRRPGSEVSGSGLGLAIVREIVIRHRGKIELDEGAQGVGLRVSVWLPLGLARQQQGEC